MQPLPKQNMWLGRNKVKILSRLQIRWDQIVPYAELAAAGVSGLLLLMAWWLSGRAQNVSIALYLIAYVVGGFAKAKEGWFTLVRERELDVNFLMLLAAAGAAGIGYWAEGGMLIFIFALSGALETLTTARSDKDLSALLQVKPQEAHLLTKFGEEQLVPVEQLCRGDQVMVRPGERIPADGKVVQGTSSVNEAALTGEAIPVDKKEGDDVLAGSINEHGALVLEVTRAGEESLFARMVRLVEEARRKVPPMQQRMERLERVYAKVVVAATILLITCSPFVWHWSWTESLYRGMVFLVVASPCALVASVMPAMLSAMSNGARNGVLLKSGGHFDTLADLSVIAFDKTGTLTEGKPRVTDVVAFRGWNEEEVLRCVASIESVSEHPVGRALTDAARQRGLPVGRPNQFKAVFGFGVMAIWEGDQWRIGKPALFAGWKRDPEIQRAVERVEREGKTVVLAERNGEFVGLVAVMDTLRAEAAEVVHRLKQLGLEVVMLTGDSENTAQAIARESGIDRVYADLLPEDKVRVVEELARHGTVAMVGDGVNDAPALARAHLGIAMGGGGTDVALETADVVLMKDDLTKLPHVIRLGRRMKRIVAQNVAFALAVIVFLVLANFIRWMNLPFGVVGHEGSTLLVILNGLRLLKMQKNGFDTTV